MRTAISIKTALDVHSVSVSGDKGSLLEILINKYRCFIGYHLPSRPAKGVSVGRSQEDPPGIAEQNEANTKHQAQSSKSRRASTEEPQAPKKCRLDSPFPVTTDPTSRSSTLPATTNSTPRPSIVYEVNHRRTSTSSTTPTAADAKPVPTCSAQSKATERCLSAR